MDQAYFEMQWPRERITLTGFAHEIMNYRYHWHPALYELSILLQGEQEFCRGSEPQMLGEDDVILISPGTGHASYGQQADTCALVLHFSAAAWKPFVKKGQLCDFPSCLSTEKDRYDPRYNRIRFYAAQICQAAMEDRPYAQVIARASLDLLMATLYTAFPFQTVRNVDEEDDQRRETVTRLISYIEQHYREKISLEDLARFSQYNRTYVSTLFKNTVGVNFYEYLTRVRFQKALMELSVTDKNLTSVALDNGFSDLKSFNARFRETLHRTPAQYRASLAPNRVLGGDSRRLLGDQDPLLKKKLGEYLRLPADHGQDQRAGDPGRLHPDGGESPSSFRPGPGGAPDPGARPEDLQTDRIQLPGGVRDPQRV